MGIGFVFWLSWKLHFTLTIFPTPPTVFLGTELFLISFCSWDVCATLHRPLFWCSFLFSHNCGKSMEKVCFLTFFTYFTKCLHMGMYAFAHTLESVLSRFTSLKEYISRRYYMHSMRGNSLNVPFMQQRLAVTSRDLPHIVYHSYELVAKRVLINMDIAGISPI